MQWPSVARFVKEKVRLFNDSNLIIDYEDNRSYSYVEFDQATDRLAWGLRKAGIKTGDRVAFLHKNHSDLLLGFLGVMKAGAVAAPINPIYTPREIQYILHDSAARMLISTEAFSDPISAVKGECPQLETVILKSEGQNLEEAFADLAGALETADPSDSKADDLAMIFYTSGTTGKPKGVMITHRNLTFGGGNTAQNYGLTPSDKAVICLPLNHIFANATPFWGSLASGGSAVVMERFQTDQVFDAIARHRVTWFAGVPTMFGYLLSAFEKEKRHVDSLRMGLSGAASLSKEHIKAFESRFGAGMLEVYGLTESTGLVTANPVFGVRKPGSIGISVSGVSVRLVDPEGRDVERGEVGELIFRGPNASPGYWRREHETEKAVRQGWVYSGDLACQDEEGYFYIASRKNELIISGGYNIYPKEIEEVLMQHPLVQEAAVVGVSDPAKGEVPKAFVVPMPGADLKPDELMNHCRRNLAAYKSPKAVEILEDLPRNATGKVIKSELMKEGRS